MSDTRYRYWTQRTSALIESLRSSNPQKWLPWLIIALGIVLRVSQYAANRSLWLDESALAVNIVNRSFSQLLEPLDFNQGASIGYLMIERLMVQFLGDSEYALRLIPLVSGVSSLFLFYAVARQYVGSTAVLIGLGLFSLSSHLIYYSSEVKQYSSDVTLSLLLLGYALYIERREVNGWRAALLGILGAIAVWISHPATFVLAGVGIGLGLSRLARGEWASLRRLLLAYVLWGMSFFAVYSISLSNLANNQVLLNYWRSGFAPFPPLSLLDMQWYVNSFIGAFDNPTGLTLSGVAALAFLAGSASMIREDKVKFALLVFPILVTLLASGLQRYPFSGRLILFLVPVALLLIAEGMEQIRVRTKDWSASFGIIMVGLLFIHPLISATDNFLRPHVAEEIRPVIGYIRQNYQNDDELYVYYGARPAFLYYGEKYGFNDEDYIPGNAWRDDWGNYIAEVDKLNGNKRIWILFSHVWDGNGVDEQKLFLNLLDGMGTRLDSFAMPGAAAYLYDLSAN